LTLFFFAISKVNLKSDMFTDSFFLRLTKYNTSFYLNATQTNGVIARSGNSLLTHLSVIAQSRTSLLAQLKRLNKSFRIKVL
jgi:hypothetical protein